MKHFHAENAGRGRIGGVIFEIYGIVAGTAFGVCAAESEETIAALEALAEDLRSAVTRITAEEYADCIKKKQPGLSFSENLSVPQPSAGMNLKGPRAALVVEGPEIEAPVKIAQTVETVAEALSLGEAKPPEEVPGVPPEQTKRGEKRKKT